MDKETVIDAEETLLYMKSGEYNYNRDPAQIFEELTNVILYLKHKIEELQEITL